MTALPVEVALAEARDAARSGDLAGAREHLDRLGGDADDPEVLDLRARVLAQDGDLDGAEDAWRGLDAARPGDPSAVAGLAAVGDVRSGRRRRRRVAAVAGAVVVVAAAAVGATLAAGALSAPREPDPPVAAAPAPVPQAPAPVIPPRASPADPTLRTVADAVAGPGVAAQVRDGGVDVTFDEGLFAAGDALTPEGRRVLAAIGPRLVGQVREVEVVGRSVVVDGGPTSGGSTVALARALTVAETLAENGPPLTTFDLASAEQTPATGDEAARARTVELRLVP